MIKERVHKALQNFLNDWHSFDHQRKPNRYSTTLDLLMCFREVSTDSKQQIITDLFEQSDTIEYFPKSQVKA